jgi:hypothetical protein
MKKIWGTLGTWVSSVLGVSSGGTGAATLADGGIVIGNGTGAVEVVTPGATTEILVGGGAATKPVWTTATGTGAPVRATSPTLVTPLLGTPTSGTLDNCTHKDLVKGDGTAGRVLRTVTLAILNGSNATTIKPATISIFNGDANGYEDNLGKSEDTGVFALDASGGVLTWQDAGISGNAVAVLSIDITDNRSGTDFTVDVAISSGIAMTFRQRTAGASVVDLTTLVDTGAIYLRILYITSA